MNETELNAKIIYLDCKLKALATAVQGLVPDLHQVVSGATKYNLEIQWQINETKNPELAAELKNLLELHKTGKL